MKPYYEMNKDELKLELNNLEKQYNDIKALRRKSNYMSYESELGMVWANDKW